MKIFKFLLISICFLTLFSNSVFSAIIRMKSGEVLKAYILSETENSIWVRVRGFDREILLSDIEDIDVSALQARYEQIQSQIQTNQNYRPQAQDRNIAMRASYGVFDNNNDINNSDQRREFDRNFQKQVDERNEELDKIFDDFFKDLGYDLNTMRRNQRF